MYRKVGWQIGSEVGSEVSYIYIYIYISRRALANNTREAPRQASSNSCKLSNNTDDITSNNSNKYNV